MFKKNTYLTLAIFSAMASCGVATAPRAQQAGLDPEVEKLKNITVFIGMLAGRAYTNEKTAHPNETPEAAANKAQQFLIKQSVDAIGDRLPQMPQLEMPQETLQTASWVVSEVTLPPKEKVKEELKSDLSHTVCYEITPATYLTAAVILGFIAESKNLPTVPGNGVTDIDTGEKYIQKLNQQTNLDFSVDTFMAAFVTQARPVGLRLVQQVRCKRLGHGMSKEKINQLIMADNQPLLNVLESKKDMNDLPGIDEDRSNQIFAAALKGAEVLVSKYKGETKVFPGLLNDRETSGKAAAHAIKSFLKNAVNAPTY